MWVRIIGAIVVLSIAGIVAGISVLKSIDFNDFKTDVEALAENATGRDVVIAGDLSLNISMSPSLNMSDVTVGNAVWGEKTSMLVLKNLKAKVDLMSLLTGQLNVDYFVVDGLTVLLQTDGKGLANWEFENQGGDVSPTQTSSGLSIIPVVRDVRLNNVDLTYIDGATQARFHVKLAKVNVQAQTFSSPMSAVIKANYNGVNLDVQSDLGSLKHLIGTQGGAFPVDLKISTKGLSLTVQGRVEQPQDGMTVEAKIQANVSNMAALSKLLGADLSTLKSIQANLDVRGSDTHYAFSNIDVRADESDLSGKIDVNLSAKRPRVTGALTSNVVKVPVSSKPTTSKSSSVFTLDPLSFDALQSADVDLSYAAKKVTLEPLSLSNLKTRVVLENGRLNISSLKLNLGGGDVSGQAQINSSTKIPKLSAKLNLQDVDIGQVIQALGFGDLASLKLNGKINVSSNGGSTRVLAQKLNGMVSLSGRDGRIKAGAIEGLSATAIRCLVARLPINNGVVDAQTVMMSTPEFDVQVTGNIDLPGERFHLRANPQARSTSLASLAVPVRIKGSLSAPYVGVDATEAVVGTVGNVIKAPIGILIDVLGLNQNTAKNDPCLKTLGGATAPVKKQAAPPPQKKSQPVNPIKDLGNALQGLFGQ